MKYALKEWNPTIEALARGLIVAIWQKDDIADESFKEEQKHFVLFPTSAPQDLDKIKKDFWFLFDQNLKPNKDNQIAIKYWAEVDREIPVENLEQLLNLSKELVNSEENLKSSWNLHPKHKGKLVLLRVYALSDPILIMNSQGYANHKSWIELKVDVPRVGSRPILSFKEFNRKARVIESLLKLNELVTAKPS